MKQNTRSSSKKNIPISIILIIALLVGHLFIFIWFALLSNIDYSYLYPTISDFRGLLACILVIIILPFVLAGLNLMLRPKKLFVQHIMRYLCVGLLLLLLPISFFTAALYRCGITSYTNDPNDYLMFDNGVTVTQEYEEYSDFLPTLSEKSNVISYSYNYDYGAIRERYEIQVEVQFKDGESFRAELERLPLEDMEEIAQNTYSLPNQHIRLKMGLEVFVSTKTIKYTMVCG